MCTNDGKALKRRRARMPSPGIFCVHRGRGPYALSVRCVEAARIDTLGPTMSTERLVDSCLARKYEDVSNFFLLGLSHIRSLRGRRSAEMLRTGSNTSVQSEGIIIFFCRRKGSLKRTRFFCLPVHSTLFSSAENHDLYLQEYTRTHFFLQTFQ